MLLVCATNIWIEASKDSSSAAARMLARARLLGYRIAVSKHSRSELEASSEMYGPEAARLAAEYEEIPYFPIGTISQLLGTISELSGTLDDMFANDRLRESLASIATQGTDIRDRGALIDALRSGAQIFVTSDKGIVGKGPRGRLQAAFSILVRTPLELCTEIADSVPPAG